MACKHVAAALLHLQATVCNNIFTTCTSQECTWTRWQHSDKYAVRLQDLHLIKAEFGKDGKMCLKPYNFDSRCAVVNAKTKWENLRIGLLICPDAVALMFLEPNISDTD